MENTELHSSVYFGIEQHFNEAARSLSGMTTLDDLDLIASSGLVLESALVAPLGSLVGLGNLSTENLKERLVELYRRFLDALVKGWDYLVTHIDTVYAQVNQLLSKVDDLVDAAKERSSSTPNSQIVDLGDVSARLAYEYKKLEPKEYITRLREMGPIMDTILIDHVSEVMNASKFISPLVESLMTIDVTNPTAIDSIRTDARSIAKFGNEVHDHIQSYPATDVSSVRGDLAVGNGVTVVKRMASLLGDRSIYVRHGNVDKAALRGEGIPFFNAISAVFSSGLVLSETDPNKQAPADTKLRTLTPDDVQSVCAALEDVLNPIRKFKMRYDRDIKLQRKRYQQLRGKLSVMARAGENSEVTLYLRRIGVAAMGLSRWYYDPFVPLMNHALRTTRASVVYCERSLSQWPVR